MNALRPDEEDNSVAPTSGDDDFDAILSRYWPSIKSKRRTTRVQELINVRLINERTAEEIDFGDSAAERMLRLSWRRMTTRVKINCSFGMVLEHKITKEQKYYHSSSNNATYERNPTLVKTEQELLNYLSRIGQSDVSGTLTMMRPNTEWQLRAITNVTFYMFKMLGMGKVGGTNRMIQLPNRLLRSKGVQCMDKNEKTGKAYTDNLCFFRCLAVRMECNCKEEQKCSCDPLSKQVKAINVIKQFSIYAPRLPEGKQLVKDFKGVECENLLEMETIYDIKIVVFELDGAEGSNVVWVSSLPKKHRKTLNLNLYENHFSLITRLDIYANAFGCPTCDATYTRANHLLRHSCKPSNASIISFPGGAFKPTPTILETIFAKTGISIEDRFPHLRFYPYRATYDIECYFPSDTTLPASTVTTEFTAVHKLLSISVSSNVPGYASPHCFVCETTADECVSQFVRYLLQISQEAERLERTRWKKALVLIENTIEKRKKAEEKFAGDKFSTDGMQRTRQSYEGLMERIDTHLCRMPVVGFNSQRYDMNVLKGPLLRYLDELDCIRLTIKRNSSLPCVETDTLRFLDICNYIAPNFSYDKYLKAFGCSQTKGFFPYEWVDDLKKLNNTELPPSTAFYSSLRGESIKDEDYEFCKRAWTLCGMKTFKDYLIWYNNLDVQPFLEAIEKQSSIFHSKGIDMLKSAISLPGLAVRWMFTITGEDKMDEEEVWEKKNTRAARVPAMLLDKSCADLYSLFRKHLTGGPSIIFHRYHERGLTRIREAEKGKVGKPCDMILGVDANALYLWCTMQRLPTGLPVRRRIENNFSPDAPATKHGKTAIGWLSWVEHSTNRRISHAMNGGETRLGEHGLLVDGFCVRDQTAYQFHGCYWHAHACYKTKFLTLHPTKKIPMAAVRAESDRKDEYIRSLGYDLTVMRECEWEETVRTNRDIKTVLRRSFGALYGWDVPKTMKTILENVMDGSFFGYIECDIETPAELEEKFSEMAPLFKNVEVSRDDVGAHMREFAEDNGFLKRPQKMLIGSLKGEKVFLFSELLRWYLTHGLVVTKIYQTFAYKPRACFTSFGDSVSKARREGDVDPSKTLLAETSKLVGNSFYGKTITDKEKHRSVIYARGSQEASKRIRNMKFVSLEEIDKDFYEIVMHKQKIKMDVPVSIGFTILQLAKLRMLQFYYDLMDKYVDRNDFQYIEMDTDSAYMALSGSLCNIIRPNLVKSFYREYGDWFPKPFCELHKEEFITAKTSNLSWTPKTCCAKILAFDRRTPGLFKEEFRGDGMIALNSKSYICWNDESQETKLSSKGLNKRNNALRRQHYKDVLFSQKAFHGVNRGFITKNSKVYTYKQRKRGLSYFYGKRQVLADGVSTINTRL